MHCRDPATVAAVMFSRAKSVSVLLSCSIVIVRCSNLRGRDRSVAPDKPPLCSNVIGCSCVRD